jgi:multidrug efflux pump subunit AcrB
MFSHFFIERPIFAAVLSIAIVLAGTVAVVNLPVAQYPPITPPSIWVQCIYPGANAQVVADSVAAPIEQQVNGVENMLYMVSQSNNDGTYQLTVTFKTGVNLNFAQVLVQNRINLALPLLPDVVKQAGVTTRKRNPDILQVIAIYSPTNRYDQVYLSNYATIKIRDELSRVEGVGDCTQFGQQDYCMRIWVDPDKLAALNMTASEVVNAVREQNMQVTAGHFGQQPASDSASFELTITTLGRLQTTEQFNEIVLRTDGSGRKVRLKDVGHAELGAKNLDTTSKVTLSPSALRALREQDARNLDTTSKVAGVKELALRPNGSLAVFPLPDANAIATARRVREKMEQLKKSFPDDVDYVISLDMTPFMQESINEVIRTLIEAIVLVSIVVLLFLQNWRSALIPLVAVPVAIVGTFAVMIAIGFTLNNLTLFGLVLAIGIVVDDAIVVVEAVEHHIEEGMSPRRAAHKAMDEVSGPVVAVALVLSAVFVPCAFITGITGQFFRQFALTIAVSTVISAFNSLTLSPALAALMLRRREKGTFEALPWFAYPPIGALIGHKFISEQRAERGLEWALALLNVHATPETMESLRLWAPIAAGAVAVTLVGLILGRPINALLGGLFRAFNWSFRTGTGLYTRVVGLTLRGSAIVLLVYGGLLVLTWWTSRQLPSGYIPNQDQGRFYIALQLPDAASLERTQKVTDHIARLVQETEGVSYITEIAGQSFTFNANGSNFGQFFSSFAPFDERRAPGLSSKDICDTVKKKLEEEIPEAKISIFTPPPVPGLGSASGFKLIIEDRGDLGFPELEMQVERVIAAGKGGHFKLSAKSFAELRASHEQDLAQIDVLKDRDFPTEKKFNAEMVEALKKAGVDNRSARTRIQQRVGPTKVGKAFRLTPESFARLVKEVQQAFDFLRPVPEEVLAKLYDLKDRDFLTRERFESALAAPLADGLEAAGVSDRKEQARIKQRVFADAENRKVISNMFSIFRATTPQLDVQLDREQCKSLGVDPKAVFDTLQIYLGSYYVNDFNRFGRTWQVVVQAKGEFRTDREKIKLLKVRNADGAMVPLGSLVSIQEVGRPINIGRYNMYPAAAILGETASGVSTGQGIDEMEALCNDILPPGMAFEWTEINYMQIDASKNIWNNLIFPLAVVFVFLVLAAQYESWALPLAVILVVPMCILGSLTGVAATEGDINIFTQIGFVVLVGLASKNAILIVEFAKHKREDAGMDRRSATLEACQLRLRPILMTSFAFILGVVPLIFGHGAGAEMRRVLGIAVFSGMLGVTLFGIFLTPVFFYVIEGFIETPLFSSVRVRQVGWVLLVLLGIATLGLPWWLPLLLGKRAGGPALAPEGAAASHNGEALALNGGHAGNGNGHLSATNGQEKAHGDRAVVP